MIRIILCLVLVFSVTNCGKKKRTKLIFKQSDMAIVPPEKKISFDRIRDNIMVPKCLNCHAWAIDKMVFDSKIEKGNILKSKLYLLVESGVMPPTGEKLNKNELQEIRDYILSN